MILHKQEVAFSREPATFTTNKHSAWNYKPEQSKHNSLSLRHILLKGFTMEAGKNNMKSVTRT